MKRRALSTVVGAVFFVIVMASTISYVAYSMDLIDNLARSVDIKQDENLNRQNEKFNILGVSITGTNKFNATLYNSGNIPVKITRLFVENTTDSTWNATKYDIDTIISPGETKYNIASNLPLFFADTESYLFNFVTERGNSEKISVNTGGNQAIHTNLFALPNIVPTKFSTVLLYEVVNNSTGQLVNVVPDMNWTKVCTSCKDPALQNGWQPASYQSLKPGEVATFQTSYTLEGSDGDIYYFNASLKNGFPGVWDRERVDINIIEEASQAGVSITAAGIGASGKDPLHLILHQETDDTPSSSYQLSSTGADGGNNGLVIKYDTSGEEYNWFTNNSTEFITITGGNWIAALQYKSQQVPPSITTKPDMVFFFDNDNYPTSIRNSQGDVDRDLRPGTLGSCNTNVPTQILGKHETNAYDFDAPNTQCFESKLVVDRNDLNDIDKNNDATAFWFKTDGPMTGSDQYFVNFVDSGTNPEYYRVYMTNNGKIAFSYKSKHPSDIMTCTSLLEYDDSQWHHVLAQRSEPGNPGTAKCEIYIDYHKDVLSREYVTNIGGNFDDDITTEGRWTVGSNKAQNGNFFNGQIDVLMHWDDYLMGSTQATDLAKTSYGFDAHKIGFAMIKTRYDGSPQGPAPLTYRTAVVPFHDSLNKPDTDDTGYKNFNYTMSMSDVTLDPGFDHRLNFTIALDSSSNSTWRNHSFDLKIDDENITPFTSYINLPSEPSNPIPGYEKFDKDDQMEFYFTNGGDRGFRFTFGGTRIVFNATDGSGSYGAIPCVVGASNNSCSNSTAALKSEQDSIWISPGLESYVKFYRATTIPSNSPEKGNLMVPGLYKGAVWVFGYDDEGLSFEKTFDLGIVTITD